MTICSIFSTRRCPDTKRSDGAASCSAAGAAFQNPEHCNFDYRDMTDWGRKMFVTPGIVIDGELVTTDLVEINLGIRILLGNSYYEDWAGQGDIRHPRSAGQSGGRAPSVESTHDSATAEAGFRRQVQLGDVAALVRRQGSSGARYRRRSARPAVGDGAGRMVDIGYVKATGNSVEINLPKTATKPRSELRMEDSEMEQHDRAQPRAHLFPGLCGRLRSAISSSRR